MYNDFVIIGPKDDPASIKGARNAAFALQSIKAKGALFISRGDRSGTHIAELNLWKAAGIDIKKEAGPWYKSVEQLKLPRGKTAYAVIKTTTTQIVASACRRCRRCPRRTEFVSRRDLRYLLRQARFGHNLANALDEGCGAERLLPQDHLNSGIQPRMILDRKVARGDDNDRDLVPDRMLLHLCYELKSIHLWHHQIENDDVRNAFPEPVKGETPILGLDQQPPLGFQPGANALSLHCVILDDQDPGWSGRRSIFRNQIQQLLAVDRLREIPNGPQRHAMPPLVYDRRHDGRNVCKLRVAA